MKSISYLIGNALGGAVVIFITSLVVTFIVKKVVIAFAREERKAVIDQDFSVLKTSLVYAAVSAALTFFGVDVHSIGYYSLPVIVVADLILANSK